MGTLSEIEMLIVKYKRIVAASSNAISLTTSEHENKAVKHVSTIAAIETYENVIKDLEGLLTP